MNSINLRDILLEELDYAVVSGFHSSVSWSNDRPIPDVSSAYFIQGVPIIYFCQLEEVDPTRIWELYRKVWSQSKVPLLYVITPQDVRIYNGYMKPPEKPEELELHSSSVTKGNRLLCHLQQLYDSEKARQEISSRLNGYKRLYLDTGTFWNTPDGQLIKRENRADQRLLNAMDQVRRHLLKDKALSDSLAYGLLGRSIFIRYLEDRGVLTEARMLRFTDGQAKDLKLALENKSTTYRLFDVLSERFHGDLFPVEDEERQKVTQDHLNLLKRFLKGDDLDTGQTSFWPYDFTHIPIELISGIYDTFLSKETRQKLGAYYTPLSLVTFIIEETLPLEKISSNFTILDPACGSGVFLVRAYQRLIEAWKKEYSLIPSAQQLRSLLTQSIFGVDIQLNAVKIAAFSLYLTMLDYLKNEEIEADDFHFPNLKDTNLIHADYFSTKVDQKFVNMKFDRIIGNPPWGEDTLTEDALQWVKEHNYPIGDNQIAQAFLWRAPHFCSNVGEITLLAPTKSTILVTMNTHEKFRQRFFMEHGVRAVVNFSALVYELFDDSLSPVVALFYRPEQALQQNKIVYGVPKPTSLSQHLGAIVLDATDIKFLEQEELLAHPSLWKIAAWGTPRDAVLIQRLEELPPLRDLEGTGQLREKILQGYIVGNKKHEASWLYGIPNIDTEKFKPYIVEIHGTVQETHFERPRSETRGIYYGPLALIRQSTCEAAFFEEGEVAYRHKITGIAGRQGQEYLLKWLVAYINSSLARYYHFLTSTSWAVERGTIIQEEYKRMPFIVPDKDDSRLKEVLNLFDQIAVLYKEHDTPLSGGYVNDIQQLRESIDELVFDIYDLSSIERQLVSDMVKYEIGFFQWAKRKQRKLDDSKNEPIRRPSNQMLVEYAESFIKTVTYFLRYQDQTLNATVYQDGVPLNVLEFELVSTIDAKTVQYTEVSETLRKLLYKLDRILLEQHASTLYSRRFVRIFDGPRFYLVRPGERRLWTRSQAFADADGFIAEIVARSKSAAMGATL